MSHRKSDLGIPRPRKSAKVVLERLAKYKSCSGPVQVGRLTPAVRAFLLSRDHTTTSPGCPMHTAAGSPADQMCPNRPASARALPVRNPIAPTADDPIESLTGGYQLASTIGLDDPLDQRVNYWIRDAAHILRALRGGGPRGKKAAQ
jgi:hypothetical protein